ncbi:MAG: C25 family cysteine peptidase [Candidatus Zixiibacteriota bacterium]
MVREILALLFLVLLAHSSMVASSAFGSDEIFEVRYDRPAQWRESDGFSWLTDEGDLTGPVGAPAVPWLALALPVTWQPETAWTVTVVAADTFSVPAPLAPQQPDVRTDENGVQPEWVLPDSQVYGIDEWFPPCNVRWETRGRFDGTTVTALSWSPYRYNPTRRQLVVIRRALISPIRSLPGQSTRRDTIAATDALVAHVIAAGNSDNGGGPFTSPGTPQAPGWVYPSDPPLGVEYVVVTSAAFVQSLRPLVEWKARRSINAGIATVEAIVSSYPAVDAAAAIREYVRAAHTSGLTWVLLAGDETIVPIRYAYAELEQYTGDLHQNQLCDLYFGELDGDWDADGDGIYGEYFDDHAELYPEVYVGRLPFADAAQAAAMADKIIAYERGPDQGDYLTRSLSVCADQMRDWSGGVGQHTLVAAVMPPAWSNDVTTMVENPSGSDPSPSNPDGPTFPSLVAQGFGWVNYYVHGRTDGFIVRSSGILGWPMTSVNTFGTDGDGNGHLNLSGISPYPGIHISAACDQGAIDLDTPEYGAQGPAVSQRLMSLSEGGAVAFIGQSRWGWVATSYKLIKRFYECVNTDSIPNHIGIYQTLAKVVFPSYRDLIYGNNLYGDPEMPVWKAAPQPLEVSAPWTFTPGPATWSIEAYNGPGPVAGALVTLAVGDSVWTVGQTDVHGRLLLELALPFATELILTVAKSGHRIWVDTLPISIIADAGGDSSRTQPAFTFAPNFPNPFNPSTELRFSLGADGPTLLSVFDVLGRRLCQLVDGTLMAGQHTIEFGGTDDHGRALASGVYFARLESGGRTLVRKMVLLR